MAGSTAFSVVVPKIPARVKSKQRLPAPEHSVSATGGRRCGAGLGGGSPSYLVRPRQSDESASTEEAAANQKVKSCEQSNESLEREDSCLLTTTSELGGAVSAKVPSDCEIKGAENPPAAVLRNSDSARKFSRILYNKKKEFQKMKKEYMTQQKTMLECCIHLKELEKKARGVGVGEVGEADPVGELRVVDVGHWGGFDLRLLAADRLVADPDRIDSEFGATVLNEIKSRLTSVSDELVLNSKQFVEHIRSLETYFRNKFSADNVHKAWPAAECASITKKLSSVATETDALADNSNRRIEGMREKLLSAIKYTQLAWSDREQLVKQLDKARQELSRARRQLEEAAGDSVRRSAPCDTTSATASAAAIEIDLRSQLSRERNLRKSLKSAMTGTEMTLKGARTRIAELERQLKDAQLNLDKLQSKCREVENKFRHRESSLEVRSKKLQEVTKTGEVTIDTLTKQRDALECRVQELSQQLDEEMEVSTQSLAEERSRYSMLQVQYAELQKRSSEKDAKLQDAEDRLREAERTWQEIHERCAKLLRIHEERRVSLIPQNAAPSVSDREVDLWKELQTTKLSLGRAKEDARKARLEKDSFLQQLAKIAQKEDETIQGKVAEEFIEKERTNYRLQETIAAMESREKNLEQRAASYEKKISELKFEISKLQNCNTNSLHRSHEDLEIENMELHTQLSLSCAERNRLDRALAVSRLMLERHERANSLQREALVLRQQLISSLERGVDSSKTTFNQFNISSVAADLSEADVTRTWSCLQLERTRVRQLEQLVQKQHEQLHRAQEERCRLEQSRTQLQRALSVHRLSQLAAR